MNNALSLQWSGYRTFACAGVLLLALAFLGTLFVSHWMKSFMLAVLLAPTLYVIARWNARLPTFVQAIFVVAMLFNAAGYLFDWFADWRQFDKIAHFYSGFAVTIAFAFMLYSPLLPVLRARPLLLLLAVTTLGTTIASLWEIAEWLAEIITGDSIIRSIADTMVDIVMGAAGALLAAFISIWAVIFREGEILQGRNRAGRAGVDS